MDRREGRKGVEARVGGGREGHVRRRFLGPLKHYL
jgi:hypothetical protein